MRMTTKGLITPKKPSLLTILVFLSCAVLFLIPFHSSLNTLIITSKASIWNMIVTSRLQHGVLLTHGLPILVASDGIKDGAGADSSPVYGVNEEKNGQDDDERSVERKNWAKSERENLYINSLLTCPYELNTDTNHFRIPVTPLNEIVFTARDETTASGNKYFNPAILTLPAGAKYQYVVFSRLVTSGSHQETHYCPAMMEDVIFAQHIEPRGGGDHDKSEHWSGVHPRNITTYAADQRLRCASSPKPLRLPSTPAFRCTGRWKDFADIPGFHDPRVFWSGKGEPLAIVNSASAAGPNGCVGLWIVDLRNVIPDLDEWLDDQGISDRSAADGGQVDHKLDADTNSEARAAIAKRRRLEDEDDYDSTSPAAEEQSTTSYRVKPKMSYPYLTEITKNPSWSRSPVEKNWVLFFPQEEQTWVMYDVLGHDDDQHGHAGIPNLNETTADGESSIAANTTPEATLSNIQITSSESTQATVIITNEPDDLPAIPSGTRSSPAQSGYPNATSYQSISSSLPPTEMSKILTKANLPLVRKSTAALQLARRQNATGIHSRGPGLKPSRSLAKLFGGGYASVNLTAADESPCFNNTHIHDRLGNPGKWHQGSNALRLVLCQHQEQATPRVPGIETCTLTDVNEEQLVNAGKVVHFMVMHRKFSNILDLPMRYERYFLVWEARRPFRLLGVSAYPVLFEGEQAQPWSVEENQLALDNQKSLDRQARQAMSKWGETYFSYTPSLAWAYQQTRVADGGLKYERGLGTGYLGEEVLLGIGMDDTQHGFVKIKVEDLLQCLRLCPDFDLE